MSQVYCEKWFKAEKRPIGLLTVEAARRLHNDRKSYAVVLSSGASIGPVISVAPPWVSVAYLDDQLREYLSYDFKEVEPHKLFLKMATHREYREGSDDILRVRRCAFDVSGAVTVEQKDLQSGEVSELESIDSLEENWEKFPPFGDYEGISREERTPPTTRRHV